jgi:hypothetical protein
LRRSLKWGTGCSSSSWIAATGLAGQWAFGCLSDEGQDEIFADGPETSRRVRRFLPKIACPAAVNPEPV